jgi:dihydroorotate dehydrogenase
MGIYHAVRPALFLLPPETAHRLAIAALARDAVAASHTVHASLRTTVAGLHFNNPVGLAAGFDKNAECFEGALRAGFGFVEIGTVTPRAQAGNPTPRVFRLVAREAVINRLGFNNEGMQAAADRLARRSGRGVIGGNIGKNKETVDAIADYTAAMRWLYPHVDYITANISSPNTPGLRGMQAAGELHALVSALHGLRDGLVADGEPRRPIFVKIAPDCDDAMLEAIAEVALATQLDGLIVSNTTLARDGVTGNAHAQEAGGLSGKPLFALSTEILKKTYRLTDGKIPLVGVGGIASAADAYAKIRAGASLVQLYTALIYQGFGLVDCINDGLAQLLARDGYATIAEAVGSDA